MKQKLIFLKDIILNIFFSRKYKLFYIVENANWSTDWDGKNITNNLNKMDFIKSKISSTHLGLRNKIIHFGSTSTFIKKDGFKNVHKSNKVVLTWFHIAPDDGRVKFIPLLNKETIVVHTSSKITKDKLVQYGLKESHIVVIPLGVDLDNFKSLNEEEKKIKRKIFNVPENVFTIGSFQKDGDGWGDGKIPKLVKGPDIFCDVVERLAKKYPIYVVLTGPARGFVIERLNSMNIPFSHTYLNNFYDLIPYYQILDLYLICSREEGGPKALIESMACGIPIVTTRVGMVPEVIEDGKDGFISDEINTEKIFEKASILLSDSVLSRQISKNALEKIKNYNLVDVTRLYWEKIYLPIIKK